VFSDFNAIIFNITVAEMLLVNKKLFFGYHGY